MSKEIKDKAKEYLKAQLSVIPTKESKEPALLWKPYQSQRIKEDEVEALFNGSNVKGLGIVCGAISGNLEVIDVDTKHDTTGSLWDNLRGLIEDNLPELYKRLVIAQTRSGGYHIYYKCSSIAGNNPKLARAVNRESLIETRGEGGYVIAPPTPKYNYIQGEPGIIPTITPEERDILFNISKSFNELQEEERPKVNTTPSTTYNSTGLSPFEDYNERGDLVALLESKGWRVVSQSGQKVNLLRPGSTDSKTSGNYHTGLKVLRVFSSSTEFNPDKGYSPAQVFSLLECNGDNKLTYRRLLELGYGEPYKVEDIRPTQIKTERIKVEVVNSANRETSVISTPGESLKIENIQTAIGEEVVINSPGLEAQDEILKAINLILQTGKRIYIKEGATEIREYRYQLRAIFNKYGTIQEESGGLTDRDKDRLLDEVVILSTKLQPIDKDVFLKEFIGLEAIKELGISGESLSITVDRLTSTRDKEAQAKEFKKLLSEAIELQDKGETDKALELLDSKVKEVKLKDKATEFSKLLIPTSEAQIKEEEANLPDSLNTGYSISGEELLLPGGALTVYAAPTNHGKTILLINTVLNVADRYPDKRFILFTYEERATAILQYFLNTYIDKDLNSSDKGNRRLLKDYFKTGSTQYIAKENIKLFEAKKDEFFKTYIETGRILVKYVDYNSQELTTAIEYVNKEATNIGGVFIDYFQLLKLPKEKSSRQEELKQICMSLKDTAVKTGLPMCLAAQFNREVTNLIRLHPTNIGEAGDIERIVNTLIGLWNMDKKPVLKGTTDAEIDEINDKIRQRGLNSGGKNMYLEILKSRDLPTGSYEFFDFNGNTGKVKNRVKEEIKEEFNMDYFSTPITSSRIPKEQKKKEEKVNIKALEREMLEKRAKDMVINIRTEIAGSLFTPLKDLTDKTILDYLTLKNSGDLIDIVLKMLKPDLTRAQIERKDNAKRSKEINK
jgi:replicative DNA helicase